MSTKTKKKTTRRGPQPGNGGRPPAHGKPMTRRISIRATAETGAAWDRIKGGDPSGVFAEMVRAYAGTVST